MSANLKHPQLAVTCHGAGTYSKLLKAKNSWGAGGGGGAEKRGGEAGSGERGAVCGASLKTEKTQATGAVCASV